MQQYRPSLSTTIVAGWRLSGAWRNCWQRRRHTSWRKGECRWRKRGYRLACWLLFFDVPGVRGASFPQSLTKSLAGGLRKARLWVEVEVWRVGMEVWGWRCGEWGWRCEGGGVGRNQENQGMKGRDEKGRFARVTNPLLSCTAKLSRQTCRTACSGSKPFTQKGQRSRLSANRKSALQVHSILASITSFLVIRW